MDVDNNHTILFRFEGEIYDARKDLTTGEFHVLCGAGEPLLTRMPNGTWRAFRHISHTDHGSVIRETAPPPRHMIQELEIAYKGTLGVLN